MTTLTHNIYNVKLPNDLSVSYDKIDFLEDGRNLPYRFIKRGKQFEKQIYDKYSLILDKEHSALDIGSHIGTHTFPMALHARRVYAFEPHKKFYSILHGNLATNLINHQLSNIEIYNLAIGKTEENRELYLKDNGTTKFKELGKMTDGIETCQVISLDKKMFFVNDCSVVKIDVEGAELEVLEGGVEFFKRNRPVIFIEIINKSNNKKHKENFDKVMEWFKNNNYLPTPIRGFDWMVFPK